MHDYARLGFLCFMLFHSFLGRGQAPSGGVPFINNFSSKTYNANTQNWSVTQDSIGNIYVGNNEGLLVYDGNAWQKYSMTSIVRSVDYNARENKIYAGLQGDFGFFERNAIGHLQYTSLASELDSTYGDFGDVWQTIVSKGITYFQTTKYLFTWNGIEVNVLQPTKNTFHILLRAGTDELYIKERGVGLLRVSEDSLSLVAGSNLFADKIVFALLPHAPNTYLVGTYRSALFLWNTASGELTPFSSEADELFIENGIYCGASLYKSGDSNRYAFGTLRGGCAILNKEGKVQAWLTQEQGIRNDKMKFLFEDRHGNLWMALNNGLSMVELSNPLRKWGEPNGIEGKVYSSYYHQNQLYVGLPIGGYWLDENMQFQQFPKIHGQTWQWNAIEVAGEEKLLVSSQGGIFEVDGKTSKYIANVNDIEGHHVFTAVKDEEEESQVYVGTDYGVAKINYNNGRWEGLARMPGFDAEIRQLRAIGKDKMYWAATYPGGISKIRILEDTVVVLSTYDSLNSPLSDYEITYMGALGPNTPLAFFNVKGVFQYNEETESFEEIRAYSQLKDSLGIEEVSFGSYAYHNGKLWAKALGFEKDRSGIYGLDIKEDSWSLSDAPYTLRLPEAEIIEMSLGNNSLWISSSEGLFELPISADIKSPIPKPTAQIRQVLLQEDSLALANAAGKELKLAYHESPITFKVSGTSFLPNTKYRYYLENEDKRWSHWTEDTKVRYTSLFEGEYTFMVQARNIYGAISEPAILKVYIAPPLWRRPAAYLLYITALVLLIWVIVRWNTSRIKAQRDELERLVELRTAEIQHKNEEITTQSIQLKEMNDNLMLRNQELDHQREEITAQAESLKEANRLVSEKNEKITASITYAQRIQQAVLPFEERITRFIPEHFILFKPRDIVSGDFYWFNMIDEHRAILAVADCTGHGVPGAFMSMLGNESLSHQILGKKIYDPSVILSMVDQDIQSSLQQQETDNKDGMEMSICLIDLQHKVLTYAGAKHPILYVQDGKMHKIKGSPFGIGGIATREEKTFAQHRIDLDRPISLYLKSDGYQDQFGGPNGRKFMTRRLRALLEEVSELDMKEQKQALEKTLKDWKGHEPQVDDILVVGIKINLK